MLISEFLDLTKLNPLTVVTTLVTVYVAVKWLVNQYRGIKSDFDDKLKTYHNKENEKEHKEYDEEHRFKTIEEKLDKDYLRIQKTESHLYEIGEQMKDVNGKLDNLSDMVLDTKIDSMRERILDFAPLAVDLNIPQSKESYTEVYKLHAEYIKTIGMLNRDDPYEKFNFGLIEQSYAQRLANKLFTENTVDQNINSKTIDYIASDQHIETIDDSH